MKVLKDEDITDTDSIVTAMNADFYEFKISNAPEEEKKATKSKSSSKINLPELEVIEE